LPRWCATARKTRGDAIAFEFEGCTTTFAEFNIKTNRVGNGLKALGVKPHERVAYLGKNSDLYFELLLGAIKAKVVMAPVNWRLAGPEVAFIKTPRSVDFIEALPRNPSGKILRHTPVHPYRFEFRSPQFYGER
jgi:acyl-CoA synthetase (AMP-forming)/AMP-acid ligase II